MGPDSTLPLALPPRLPLQSLRLEILDGAQAGTVAGGDADTVTVGSAEGNDIVVNDPTVSRFHAELRRCAEGVRISDNGSTNGTFLGDARIEQAVVGPGTLIRFGRTRMRVVDGRRVDVALFGEDRLGSLRGRSPAMRRLMASVERAAKSAASVLVVGESGTGKEVVARTIHEMSSRAERPFVTVDCGALSPTLVASELFGHERGAFTGADRQHVGAFERADGGTIFLDEIGELPPSLQSNLLGVLERRKLRRLGGRTDLDVDIRVVSATNRDLRSEVNRSAFRLDLYYRLAVVVLAIPPLRERPDDVPLLVEHFLREGGYPGPVEQLFSAETMRALEAHYWRGNARELRNLVEATVAMGEAPPLSERAEPTGGADPIGDLLSEPYGAARGLLLHQFEARYLPALLARNGGNVSRAAREARMDRSHLIDLLRRHGLAVPKR